MPNFLLPITMKMQNRALIRGSWVQAFLRWVNLRPEESERTLLMFVFYTTTSIGVLWLEHSAVALFLKRYGAELLPIIYIASAAIGAGFGFLYSWLSRIVPLRSLLVAIAIFMALPLFLLRIGLQLEVLDGLIILVSVFALRLWIEAIDVLNDLNTTIAANQLFNIREIKRTYPLISSGVLVADVLSGFSLPIILKWVGLPNVIILAAIMMLMGAGTLYILSQRYQQSFPDRPARNLEELQPEFTSRRVRGPLARYVIPLFVFFILAQVLYLVVDFQYLGQLEQKLDTSAIASFLGLFSGVVGIMELGTQWFLSSRLIERLGVFVAAMMLPASLAILSLLTFTHLLDFFWGLIALKFVDELFRYTFIASITPVLFQPLPEGLRNSLQAAVRGIAQTLSTGITGIAILSMIAVCYWAFPNLLKDAQLVLQSHIFLAAIFCFSGIWLVAAWILRSNYVSLLVQSAQSERLMSYSDVDLRAFKRAVVDTLEKDGTEADKRSCIQLLCQIDPMNVGEVLSPLLTHLSPALQRQSLEAMLEHPNPIYVSAVQELVEQKPPPEVLAVALRYVWLTEKEPDIDSLKPYLQDRIDPIVRGTAAALILRRGSATEKAEATNTLRRMLTSSRERERVMGCRALGEADYLQALRLFIPNLLQDESLRVRCALLEVIASTRLDEYYPSLLRGLHYKSTREAARTALVRIGDDVIPFLVELAEDFHKSDLVRMQALSALGEIGTQEALNQLVLELMTSWGTTRRNILRILLKMPKEAGIEGVLERFGRSGIETLIEQELLFLGQIYAALLDLSPKEGTELRVLSPEYGTTDGAQGIQQSALAGMEAELLRRALRDCAVDVIERCFLLMKFLYPFSAIQAAAFNLESDSRSNIALGLEILDNTLDLSRKRILLGVLDRRSEAERLQNLSEMVPYEPMSPSDRLRRLLEMRHFLSDWPLACCFHLARTVQWSLTPEATLICLRHHTGFVREAAIAYLRAASPRVCMEMLPGLKNDPDRLVAAQVQQIMVELAVSE